jgi:predicted house-cleaning noncanonical NTP pyrophosphatase (MazG superfamily)
MTKVYNKLVRDKIPAIIAADGKKLKSRILNDEEHLQALIKKLSEELKEFEEALSVEELADLQEIIHAIADAIGTNKQELEKVREEKAEKRGGFNQKIFLESVED